MYITRFQCQICGKLTAGRLPRAGSDIWDEVFHKYRRVETWHVNDGTMRYPRRHKGVDGKPCPGNMLEAEWTDIEI